MNLPRTLVVGIGSPHGDDQVGWRVAEALTECRDETVQVRLASSPSALIDWLDGVERLIVCDACRTEREAGAIQRWTWPDPTLARTQWSGTHDVGLCAVLQLAEQLGRLPRRVAVWAVEATSTAPLRPMSPAALAAIPRLAELVKSELLISDLKTNPCTNSP